MTHTGVVLIVVNRNYEENARGEAAKKEVFYGKAIGKNLGCLDDNVLVLTDADDNQKKLSKLDVLNFIDKAPLDINTNFVIFIGTGHGGSGFLVCSDNDKVKENEIELAIAKKVHQGVKLYFWQHCRGSQDTLADNPADAPTQSLWQKNSFRFHATADMYVAYRTKGGDSPFLKAIKNSLFPGMSINEFRRKTAKEFRNYKNQLPQIEHDLDANVDWKFPYAEHKVEELKTEKGANGWATYTNSNGDRYEGHYLNGKKSGSGEFRFSGGNLYKGEFVNNKMHGSGIYTESGVYTYKGMFKNEMRSGVGTMIYDSGASYHGDWLNDKMSGKGIFTQVDGSRYEGDMLNDQYHGKGIYTWTAGDLTGNRYEGDWLKNKKNGKGTFTFSNGNLFKGEYLNDKRNGRGTFQYANGNLYKGEYLNDRKSGRGTFQYANGERYEGEFVNGFRNGRGSFTYSNGALYVGEYRNDKRHGEGIYTYSNGTKLEGQWRNDSHIKNDQNE